jgi:hypothetical protein
MVDWVLCSDSYACYYLDAVARRKMDRPKGQAMTDHDYLLGRDNRWKFISFVAFNTVLTLLIEHIWLNSLMAGSYGIEILFVLPTITWFVLLLGYRKLRQRKPAR